MFLKIAVQTVFQGDVVSRFQGMKTFWNLPTMRHVGYRTVHCLMSSDVQFLGVLRVVRQRVGAYQNVNKICNNDCSLFKHNFKRVAIYVYIYVRVSVSK